jgi:hypothetical protein
MHNMKTHRFVSATLGLAALFAASPVARAEVFDFTGTTVSSTLQVGDQTFNTGPLVVGTDYPTVLGAQFVTSSLSILFDVYDDTSTYLFSDHQGLLLISYSSGDPEGPAYTLEAGVSFVITFDFFSAEAQTITDFEFVQGSSNLLAGFTSQFDAATSTLTLTSTQDIELQSALSTIEGRWIASPIPEPASFALFAALPIAALALGRRKRR